MYNKIIIFINNRFSFFVVIFITKMQTIVVVLVRFFQLYLFCHKKFKKKVFRRSFLDFVGNPTKPYSPNTFFSTWAVDFCKKSIPGCLEIAQSVERIATICGAILPSLCQKAMKSILQHLCYHCSMMTSLFFGVKYYESHCMVEFAVFYQSMLQ